MAFFWKIESFIFRISAKAEQLYLESPSKIVQLYSRMVFVGQTLLRIFFLGDASYLTIVNT
jgi:hypothetical protein